MKNTKAKQQKRHAKKRFAERLGIKLHQNLKAGLVRQIQTGQAKFLGRTSNRAKQFECDLGEEKVCVVYDNQWKNIVTVWKLLEKEK